MLNSFAEEISYLWFLENNYFVDLNVPVNWERSWGDIDLLCYKPGELVVVECKATIQTREVEEIIKRLERIPEKLASSSDTFLTPAYQRKYEEILHVDNAVKPRLVIVYDDCGDKAREEIDAHSPKIEQLAARDLLAQLLIAVKRDRDENRGSGARRNCATLRILWQLAERSWINISAVNDHIKSDHLGHPKNFLK